MQQIGACTHDGTGAKPVIRARLLVRILFSVSVSKRRLADLIAQAEEDEQSQHADHVLPLVQQGD